MYIWTLVVSTVQWLGFLLSLKGGWAQHSFLSFTDFSLILTCYWARRLKTSRESWDLVQRASRVQSLLPWRIAHHWGRIAVIKAAAAFAVNVNHIDAIGHWMSIAFSIVGLMREGRGGGEAGLNCLSVSLQPCYLAGKPDPQLLICKGKWLWVSPGMLVSWFLK